MPASGAAGKPRPERAAAARGSPAGAVVAVFAEGATTPSGGSVGAAALMTAGVGSGEAAGGGVGEPEPRLVTTAGIVTVKVTVAGRLSVPEASATS